MPIDKCCVHLHLLKGEVKVLKWHLGESSGFEQGRKCSRGRSRKEEGEKGNAGQGSSSSPLRPGGSLGMLSEMSRS